MAIFATKKESTDAKPAAVSAASASAGIPGVLFGPRVSEKSAKLSDKGKYVFNIAKSANKLTVKKAVEQAYKVNVVQVNILNTEGKLRNYGRTKGKMSDFKKAIVTLKQGQKIETAGAV